MARIKILAIDDEKEFGQLVKMNLELLDDAFEIINVSSGKEGVKKALSDQPDLILLHVMMPKMDGMEVLKKLKGNDKTSTIPVIMLTAKDDDESKLKAHQLYNDDYLIKPVGAPELKEKIIEVLRRYNKA